MGKNQVCSQCGREAAGGTLIALVSTAQPSSTHFLCGRCAAEQHASTLHTVEEADRFIAEVTEQLATLEKMISKFPQMPEIPQGLGALALTPLTVYSTLQFHLAAFKSRRMKLITEIGSEERLRYEIRLAIEAENYELAAELQKQLAERNGNEPPAST